MKESPDECMERIKQDRYTLQEAISLVIHRGFEEKYLGHALDATKLILQLMQIFTDESTLKIEDTEKYFSFAAHAKENFKKNFGMSYKEYISTL